MRYSKLDFCSVVDGPGIRVSLFVSGCRLACPGCFNKAAQDFAYGQEFTSETIADILTSLDNEHIAGLSILGGEPFDPKNVQCVSNLVTVVREWLPSKSIWIWSGYTHEKLEARKCRHTQMLINNIDVLVDGPFVESLKDPTLQWRGSGNQRVLFLQDETNPNF